MYYDQILSCPSEGSYSILFNLSSDLARKGIFGINAPVAYKRLSEPYGLGTNLKNWYQTRIQKSHGRTFKTSF
jgi:hypothetical protein